MVYPVASCGFIGLRVSRRGRGGGAKGAKKIFVTIARRTSNFVLLTSSGFPLISQVFAKFQLFRVSSYGFRVSRRGRGGGAKGAKKIFVTIARRTSNFVLLTSSGFPLISQIFADYFLNCII